MPPLSSFASPSMRILLFQPGGEQQLLTGSSPVIGAPFQTPVMEMIA